MKKLMIILLLAVANSGPVVALNNNARTYWNPITLYNETSYSIYYRFSGFTLWPWSANYSIKPGETDIYHSGIGDTRVILNIYGCANKSANGECLTWVDRKFHCNSELIKSIRIKTLTDIEITCLDGGSTSCILPW